MTEAILISLLLVAFAACSDSGDSEGETAGSSQAAGKGGSSQAGSAGSSGSAAGAVAAGSSGAAGSGPAGAAGSAPAGQAGAGQAGTGQGGAGQGGAGQGGAGLAGSGGAGAGQAGTGVAGSGGAGAGGGCVAPVPCPGFEPVDGAPCDPCTSEVCGYDRCDKPTPSNSAAECLPSGVWKVSSQSCAVVKCGTTSCPAGLVCLKYDVAGPGTEAGCAKDPCFPEPLGCGCAGPIFCKGLQCIEGGQSTIVCSDKEPN